MPDLTPITVTWCTARDKPVKIKQYTIWLETHRNDASCDCPSFKYRKNCKHINEAENKSCSWIDNFSDIVQTEDGLCPKCGHETTSGLMMV